MTAKASRRLAGLAVLGAWIFHAAGTLEFLRVDTFPPTEDAMGYYEQGVNFLQHPYTLWHLATSRPPMLMLATIPFYWAAGSFEPDVACQVNLLFLGILLWSVHRIGSRLGGPWTGALSAVLLSLFPGIYGMTRVYSPQIATAAWVSLCLLGLLKSDGFRRLLPVLGAALALAAALLTWPIAIAYVAVPAAVLFFSGWRINPGDRHAGLANRHAGLADRRRVLVHLLGAGILLILPLLPWYLPRLQELFLFYTSETRVVSLSFGDNPIFSFKSLFYYFGALWRVHLGMLFFPVFVWALLRFVAHWDKRWILPVSWAGGSWLVLFFVAAKVDRYFIGAVPALALLVAGAVAGLPGRGKKIFAGGALVLLGLVSYLGVSFRGQIAQGKMAETPEIVAEEVNRYSRGAFVPRTGNWQGERILDRIREDLKRNRWLVNIRRDRPLVVVPRLTLTALYSDLKGIATAQAHPLQIEEPWIAFLGSLGETPFPEEAYRKILEEAHYALETNTLDLRYENDPRMQRFIERSEQLWKEYKPSYEAIEEFALPYHFRATLLRNNTRKPWRD